MGKKKNRKWANAGKKPVSASEEVSAAVVEEDSTLEDVQCVIKQSADVLEERSTATCSNSPSADSRQVSPEEAPNRDNKTNVDSSKSDTKLDVKSDVEVDKNVSHSSSSSKPSGPEFVDYLREGWKSSGQKEEEEEEACGWFEKNGFQQSKRLFCKI